MTQPDTVVRMSDSNELFHRYFVYYPAVYLRGQWVPQYLRTLRRSQHLTWTELRQLQDQRLQAILRWAVATVPHYRASLKTVAPEHLTLANLALLPTVTKQQVRADEAGFRSTELLRLLTPKTTGGSTGQPMTIWKTRESMAWELAATHRGYEWAGIAIGDRQARFWGVPQEPTQRRRARWIDAVTNRLRVSAFAFTREDLERAYHQLAAFEPSHAYGYVSMLEEFASLLQQKGWRLPSVRSVVATSEVLGAGQRERIEAGFGCRVFNEYGCGELGTIAHECERGSLHLSAENLIVEVLDGERPCGPGEQGEIVVTELHNRAMPLIRYRMGDYGILGDGRCDCGRSLPTIAGIHGRVYDMLTNSHGRRFHPESFMYMVEDAKRLGLGIGAFQLVEQAPGALLFRIVRDPGYSARTEDFLRQRVHEAFDADATVHFEEVQALQREPSGKLRVVKAMATTGVGARA